ncbi:hypothetical protein Ciccas_011040 [Cichlidogyrus casuarinus]|uniref:Uncharacterized protein n=1 Tax=Cichlidogyrus casuarinus TaxID=1844966 RepID=A0ABD2PSE7_9PLAT
MEELVFPLEPKVEDLASKKLDVSDTFLVEQEEVQKQRSAAPASFGEDQPKLRFPPSVVEKDRTSEIGKDQKPKPAPRKSIRRSATFNSIYDVPRFYNDSDTDSDASDSSISSAGAKEISLRDFTTALDQRKPTKIDIDSDETSSTISSLASDDVEMNIHNMQVASVSLAHSKTRHLDDQDGDFLAPMPLSWQTGRYAIMDGHFKDPKNVSQLRPTEIYIEGRKGYDMLPDNQKTMIREPSKKDTGNSLKLMIWPSGDAMIEQTDNKKSSFSWTSPKRDQHDSYQIRYFVRPNGLGVTLNDEVSYLAKGIDPTHFRVIRIPESNGFNCDSLIFPNELTLPLIKKTPEYNGLQNRHLGMKLLRSETNKELIVSMLSMGVKVLVNFEKRLVEVSAKSKFGELKPSSKTYEDSGEIITLVDVVLHEVERKSKYYGHVSVLLDGMVVHTVQLPDKKPIKEIDQAKIEGQVSLSDLKVMHNQEIVF